MSKQQTEGGVIMFGIILLIIGLFVSGGDCGSSDNSVYFHWNGTGNAPTYWDDNGDFWGGPFMGV